MITLYRYENKFGEGPYRANSLTLYDIAGNYRIHSDDDHPAPWEDFTSYWDWDEMQSEDYIYACPSLELLEEWFEGYNQLLLDNGYSVYKIEVSDAKIGISGKQAMFLPEDVISQNIVQISESV